MSNNVIKDVMQLDFNNYKSFIEKYGLINDFNVAKMLLVLNDNIWLVLDNELKSKNELLMYHQPTGIIKCTTYESLFGEYEREYNYKEIPLGYIDVSINKYGYGEYQVPINLPEDFDYETYFLIQDDYKKNRRDSNKVGLTYCPDEYDFDYDAHTDFEYFVYNRAYLPDIVEKYYNKKYTRKLV